MNYIAHLHTAQYTGTSLLGSFLGDFVKGSQLLHLPHGLQLGVRLHRKVDVFTDAHPDVLGLKSDFSPSIRKMSGIVLDIYFDHLLMLHWEQFAAMSATQIFSNFYQELENQHLTLNKRFSLVRSGLLTHQWLHHYDSPEHCHAAFLSIEKRLSGKVQFADEAMLHVSRHHFDIEQAFLRFYPQLLDYSKGFVANLPK